MPSAYLAQGLLILTQNQKQYFYFDGKPSPLDRDLEIFLELARGYRARAGLIASEAGSPVPCAAT